MEKCSLLTKLAKCILNIALKLTLSVFLFFRGRGSQAQIQCDSSLRSKRFLSRFVQKAGTRAKKKMNDGGGGGERRNRLPANPTILKNCVRPRTQLLIGAVRVVLITQHSKHQSNQVCFVFVRQRSGLIRFVVADYKCFGLIFIGIVFVRRFRRSESSKYNWRSSSGDIWKTLTYNPKIVNIHYFVGGH